MSWSLNEVESLARKAARGSGLSWGLAEEAGRATRWLVAHGLAGADALAHLLSRNDQKDYAALRPDVGQEVWQAAGGPLCPIIAGASICDHAAVLAEHGQIRLGPTSYPMLLLPFVSGASQLSGKSLEVAWSGTSAQMTPDSLIALETRDTLDTPKVQNVTLSVTASALKRPLVPASRAEIPAAVAKTLNALAHRTYAPDTPESRMAGAGAGLTDND